MSNELTVTKAEFALALSDAGLDVQPFVPERIVPPIIVFAHGSPYLEMSNFKDDYKLSLELTLVGMTATNESATEALDELICDTLTAINNLSYAQWGNVSKPFGLAVNNAEYLSATVTVDLFTTI